jgi:predicted RNA-binding protein YlqC (UPF0109 family)
MKDLVQFIAQKLVNNPNAVEVREIQGEAGSLIELRVAKEDLGRVIGKQGRTAHSVRTILQAVATRTGRKVALEIIEDWHDRGVLTRILPPCLCVAALVCFLVGSMSSVINRRTDKLAQGLSNASHSRWKSKFACGRWLPVTGIYIDTHRDE